MLWNRSKWSEAPGCFERHLQRRDGNILFPVDRRKVTKAEIAKAQEKDKLDYDSFIQAVKAFGGQLENSEDSIPGSTLRDSSLLQEVQALLERAVSIGGNIQNALRLLERTEDGMMQCLKSSVPDGADLLEKAKALSATTRIPFFTQMKRRDTPILESEEIPTLLSEDLETISVVGLMSRSFPDFKPSETDVVNYLAAAIREGFSERQAQEIMSAWHRA